jgi:hypothetical protein
VFGGQPGQFGDQLAVPAQRQPDVDAPLGGLQPLGDQLGKQVPTQRLATDVGQRLTAPQRQRLVEHLCGALPRRGLHRRGALRTQPVE